MRTFQRTLTNFIFAMNVRNNYGPNANPVDYTVC